MAKKLLCVVLSVLMVVSLLPMGVMAEETELALSTIECKNTAALNSGVYTSTDQYTGYLEVPITSVSAGDTVTVHIKGNSSATFRVWLSTPGADVAKSNTYKASEDSSYTNGSDFDISIELTATDTASVIEIKGESSALSLSLTYVGITYPDFGSTSTTSYELVATETISSFTGGKGFFASNIDTVREALKNGGYMEVDAEATTTAWFQVGVENSSYGWSNSASTVGNITGGAGLTTVTITSADFGSVADFDDVWRSIYVQGGSTLNVTEIRVYAVAATPETSTASGIIYVNEDYHALLLNGYFISIPHTDDNGDGYCDVCNEYIGSEDSELEVVTIDGVDYYVVVSEETSLSSSSWNTAALSNSSTLAAALNTEGAILQITRDTENLVSYVSTVVWDKFGLNANGTNVMLSTSGTTTEDEPESEMVAYTSDDGYTVTYDGAAVYAALEAAGIANASSYSLISCSSSSYTITSVAVLVPVGTVVGEDVDVTEPAEVGDTTTEDDGEDDADSVDVADNADDAAESNPTTGVVLALVPMAIAGFAVVASKRR